MKRPILIIMIGYIIGILWGVYLKITILPIIFLYPIYYLYQKKSRNCYLKFYLKKSVLIILIISSLFSNLIVMYLNKKYDLLYSNIDNVSLIGTIVSNKKEKQYKNLYKIKVKSINNSRKYKNTYLYLYTPKNVNYKYGDLINIKGEYKKPDIQRNYKGFSYKNYFKTEKIYGSIQLKENHKILKNNNINIIFKLSNYLSIKIQENIKKVFSKDISALLIGILLGNKENIDDEIISNFKDANIAHLLAVSGAHINYIILGVAFLISVFKINKRYGNLIIIMILVVFMFITNFQISVVRACLSASLILLSKFLFKQSDVINSMSLSLLIILIVNPFSLFNISLQLSFGGTLGILLFYNRLYKKCKYKILNIIKSIIFVSISAQIIIFPIMLMNFGTISFSFFISNLLVNYIFAITIILGLFWIIISLLSIKISYSLSFILNIFLKAMIMISEIGANLPFSKLYVAIPKSYVIFLYYVFLMIFVYFKNISILRKKRIINFFLKNKVKSISIIIIFILIISIFRIIPGNLKIYFIDVGQGDSTLIVTPMHKTILIDGGGSESFNVGEKILLPYIQNRCINKIDYAMISHFDTDHCQGIMYLLDKIKIKNVIIGKQFEKSENYSNFLKLIKQKRINVIVVDNGSSGKSQKIQIEKDLFFNILWPIESNFINENSLNNNSVVAKLYYKNFSILFTGDIEEIAEKEILQEYKNDLQLLNSTILKVGHHGSKTSSIPEFIETVKPKIALIGVGENNKFGHPNDEVLDRLQNIRNTDI